MAWQLEIGLEFVDIIVISDKTESRSTLSAMKNGSRMITETGPVGSLKSNGIVERPSRSLQGMIRTIRSATEEKLEVM